MGTTYLIEIPKKLPAVLCYLPVVSFLAVRVMSDVFGGDDEDDVLGEIRGVIADALEVT